MQFVIKGDTGFKVTEEKAVYQSKKGRAKVHCPVEANYTDKSLEAMPAQGAKDFFTKFGINLEGEYRSKFAAFGKEIEKKLNKLEDKLDKAEAEFVKKAKKKAPGAAAVESFVQVLNKALKDGCQAIADEASKDYKKMVESIVHKVREKTLKAMGAAGKASLKKKAVFAFKVVAFIAVVVAITVAAIALPPVGAALAVGAAALVVKGLSATITLFKEAKDFAKNYEKAVTTAGKDLKSAEAAVDKALAQVRVAKDSYTALEMKLANSIKIMKAAEAKAASDKDPQLAQAKKKISESMAEIEAYKKALGNPDIAMKELETARASMRKAGTLVPEPSKTSAKIDSLADKAKQALDFAGKVLEKV
ncbi:MAG: hypothetical protein ABJX32_05025 [Tateyamaria sp.]|uniref:hypothetical protein n=1 Tax=Tateyamaria sp. TaxID=1929288 RepID=UPI00329E6986